MEKRVFVVSLLLVNVCMCFASSRINSRRFHWDGEDDLSNPSHPNPQQREDRKLIFINNKAYDLSEEEQDKVWDLYLNKGHVIQTEQLNNKPSMDSLSSVMNSRVDEEVMTEKQFSEPVNWLRQNLDHAGPSSMKGHHYEAVKASRFVADPDKMHLIEKVDEEEMQSLLQASTTPAGPNERVVTESAPTDTSTVRYEYTQVNVLSFLWNEFKNIGELLGREMLGSVSGTLYYLWESFVRYVRARGSRAIQDMSNEL